MFLKLMCPVGAAPWISSVSIGYLISWERVSTSSWVGAGGHWWRSEFWSAQSRTQLLHQTSQWAIKDPTARCAAEPVMPACVSLQISPSAYQRICLFCPSCLHTQCTTRFPFPPRRAQSWPPKSQKRADVWTQSGKVYQIRDLHSGWPSSTNAAAHTVTHSSGLYQLFFLKNRSFNIPSEGFPRLDAIMNRRAWSDHLDLLVDIMPPASSRQKTSSYTTRQQKYPTLTKQTNIIKQQ